MITAARRELAEETALEVEPKHLEQIATFGAPARNPRAPTISVAYLGIQPAGAPSPVGGTDARLAAWRTVEEIINRTLPFDHREILAAGVECARNKVEYTSLAAAFVGEPFTMAELRRVYEIIWGNQLDPGNYQRKIQQSEGLIERVGDEHNGPPAAGRHNSSGRGERQCCVGRSCADWTPPWHVAGRTNAPDQFDPLSASPNVAQAHSAEASSDPIDR